MGASTFAGCCGGGATVFRPVQGAQRRRGPRGHRTLRTTSRVVLPSTLLRQACTACGGAEVGGHRFGQHTFMGVENHFSSEDDPDAVATDGLTAGCPCTLPGRSRLPAVPERAAVVGLSNSATQRERILEVAAARGFRNVDVVTHINTATLPARHFVRMLSVEMFEHMKNYEALLAKVAASRKDDGLLFVHIFSHKALAYDFNVAEDDSWMARYYLTCGHDALGRPPPALPAARQPRRPLVAQRHALRQNLRGVAGQHGPPRRRGPQALCADLRRRPGNQVARALAHLLHDGGDEWGVSVALPLPEERVRARAGVRRGRPEGGSCTACTSTCCKSTKQ